MAASELGVPDYTPGLDSQAYLGGSCVILAPLDSTFHPPLRLDTGRVNLSPRSPQFLVAVSWELKEVVCIVHLLAAMIRKEAAG